MVPESRFTHGFIYRQQLAFDNKPSILESVLKAAWKIVNIIQTAAPEQLSLACYIKKEANKRLRFSILSGGKMLTKTIQIKDKKFFHDTDKVNKKIR